MYASGLALALSCLRTASSITPIRPMPADWTASGACTSGSTALRRGATKRASGGVITTATSRWHDDRRSKRNRAPQSCCGARRGRLVRSCGRAHLRCHGTTDLFVRRRRGHDVLGRAWCVAPERNGPDVSSDERLPLSAVAETAFRSIGGDPHKLASYECRQLADIVL